LTQLTDDIHANRFYAYLHRDPETREVVYVGKGTGGRAWDVSRNRNGHPDHQEWMYSLIAKGYIPSDWVTILLKNLTEEQAFNEEKRFLHENGTTRFNRQSGERNYQAKLTDAQARDIYRRANMGVSHKELAADYGVSRSAVSMIASRKQWRAATACLV
jgi:hypothetical protein